MKKTLIFFSLFCMLFQLHCTSSNADSSMEELIKTDKDFAQLSFENGMHDAFINFAAEDAILLRGDRTLYGMEEIKKYFNERKNLTGTLYWLPLKAEVSGDLGYTFGEWKFFMKDSAGTDTAYGNYMSIWKKQSDGSWKYVMDGGNSNAFKNQKDD